jgi:putative tryptophan/tyrosine transport system substrate-binding protein
MTSRRAFVGTLAASLATWPLALSAQPGRRTPVVGFLTLGGIDSLAQFRAALRDLGYVEGKDYAIESRSANGNPESLRKLATELVRSQVDVLYVTGPAAVRAARAATGTISIVALDLETDPVASGLVGSLARPGGNVTGLFLDLPDLAGKWLDLLGQAAPGRRRIAVLWDSTTGDGQLAAAKAAAARLDLELSVHGIRSADGLDEAMRGAVTAGARAMLMLSSPIVSVNSRRIADFTVQRRLPAISPFRAFADAGGLMSYGPNLVEFRRFSATYVDRILKGARPADLPIQQPLKFEFVVNARTARLFGLAVPQSLLLRADEVIQ